jgi:hypothetical protein
LTEKCVDSVPFNQYLSFQQMTPSKAG